MRILVCAGLGSSLRKVASEREMERCGLARPPLLIFKGVGASGLGPHGHTKECGEGAGREGERLTVSSWESLVCGLCDQMSDSYLEKSKEESGPTLQELPACPVLGEAEWTADRAWVELHERNFSYWTSHQSPSEDEPPLDQLSSGQWKIITASTVKQVLSMFLTFLLFAPTLEEPE